MQILIQLIAADCRAITDGWCSNMIAAKRQRVPFTAYKNQPPPRNHTQRRVHLQHYRHGLS